MDRLPEIAMDDYDCDGYPELRTSRLFHNGTANAVETTWYKLDAECLDTAFCLVEWIDPMLDRK